MFVEKSFAKISIPIIEIILEGDYRYERQYNED